MHACVKHSPPRSRKAERNTFGLPTGEPIRRELRQIFRAQRTRVLAVLERRKKDAGDPLPDRLPALDPEPMVPVMTPIIQGYWDRSGVQFCAKIGFDPDKWRVTNPHTQNKIQGAALAFCTATNATTSLALQDALAATRQALVDGVVTRGESVPVLTKKVNAIFDSAEKFRARRIAQTEASRAVHAAQEEAGRQSGLVAGWEWLLSGDACPLCQTIGRRARFVQLGQAFAVVGDNPTYSEIRYPPGHPHCNCTIVEVLRSDRQPDWAHTLNQPRPEAEDYPDGQLPGARRPKPVPYSSPHPTVPDRVPKPEGRPAPPATPLLFPPDLDLDHLRTLDLHQVEPSWHLGDDAGRRSYGGVLFDDSGRVLLREPTNHFDGYHWTFPKGRNDAGEHPVDTGLREVREETGQDGAILGLVPGKFKGGTGNNFYFVMRSKGITSNPDAETQSTRWATPEEARALIGQSTNETGRKRDLAVLDAAAAQFKLLQSRSDVNDHLRPARALPQPEASPAPAKPGRKPRAPKAGKPPPAGFPADPDTLQTVKALGGSTGAELVKDADGKLFVRKRGANADHLREEAYADSAYQALGVKVPKFQFYETAKGPVKLAEYIPGRTLATVKSADPKLYAKAVKQLQKHFAVDALFGNWDVIGLAGDNVLVDDHGNAWRIDNGGSFRFRAMGSRKTADQWNPYPVELWTLRDAVVNPQTAAAFGPLSMKDLSKQILELDGKPLPKTLPLELMGMIKQRSENLKDVARTADLLMADKFVPDYADGFTKHMLGIRKAGITARMPKAMKQKSAGSVSVVDENGKPWDHLRGNASLVGDLSRYVESNGGQYATIKGWMAAQAGSSWSDQSKALKRFIADARGSNYSQYFWNIGATPADSGQLLKKYAEKVGGLKAYATAMQSQHAFTYEYLRRADFPNKDAGGGTIKLKRTEDLAVMRANHLKPGDKGVKLLRGVAESTSIYKKVTVRGSELTIQHVPLHRILGTYWQERYPDHGDSAFMGDSENEFVAILEGIPFEYEH